MSRWWCVVTVLTSMVLDITRGSSLGRELDPRTTLDVPQQRQDNNDLRNSMAGCKSINIFIIPQLDEDKKSSKESLEYDSDDLNDPLKDNSEENYLLSYSDEDYQLRSRNSRKKCMKACCSAVEDTCNNVDCFKSLIKSLKKSCKHACKDEFD